MLVLENAQLYAAFDRTGRLCSLRNKAVSGLELISAPADESFSMTLAGPDCKEILVLAEEQEIIPSRNGDTLSFRMEQLRLDNGRTDAGTADIALTLQVTLEGECLLFTADLESRDPRMVVDLAWPQLGCIRSLGSGKPALYWPVQPGRMIMNIGEVLSGMEPSRENGSNAMKIAYPGPAVVGAMALTDRENTLFLTSEDPEFLSCHLKITGSRKVFGGVTMTVDKHLCCREGRHTLPPVRMRLYQGDWHHGAAAYARWMEPYRKGQPAPDWVREMTGYFLVINKQQYGYEMWDYTTLPQLYALAQAHGFDTLGLFGWYATGHDNNYPDLEVSQSMGGPEVLRDNIRAVQSSGGHVTLYFQGHLIDVLSDYYQNGPGARISSKTLWGSLYSESYPKSHRSDFLADYSNRTFSVACPSCPEWQELMLQRARWIADLGADGALFDQIGGMQPYVCFDESHPHKDGNPAKAFPHGQLELVTRLQQQAHGIRPDFGFFAEQLTDYYGAHVDATHIGPIRHAAPGERCCQPGDDRGDISFPELFRYCFPDAVVTTRNGNPFIQPEVVSFSFVMGLVPEMELRYRQDKKDILADCWPQWREWAKKVSDLRARYKQELAHGRFVDTDGLENPHPLLLAKGYRSGETLTVAMWNDSGEAMTPALQVPGYDLVSFEMTDGVRRPAFCSMEPGEAAVAVFRPASL